MDKYDDIPVERHPLAPFLPDGARLLMLGSFPPPRRRWCMDFYYPNRSNMMWEVMGEVFYGDSQRFVDAKRRTFRQADIEDMLRQRGIAVFDTAVAVRRLAGNASDKDLEVVERTDLAELLGHLPLCHDIACTGHKSAEAICADYGVAMPTLGGSVDFVLAGRPMRLHRMPSTSRAYPMSLERKATHYAALMRSVGIL